MRKPIKSFLFDYPLLVIPLMMILCLLLPLSEEILDGIINRWQMIPPPPSRPIKILGTGDEISEGIDVIVKEDGQGYVQGDLYILAENGRVYYYERSDQNWRQGQADHVYDRVSCGNTTGPFWERKQGECVKRRYYNLTHHFLLEQDGTLWYWFDSPQLPSYSFCSLTGLAIGIMIVIIMALTGQKSQAFPSPTS
jgi:hypothetical protein